MGDCYFFVNKKHYRQKVSDAARVNISPYKGGSMKSQALDALMQMGSITMAVIVMCEWVAYAETHVTASTGNDEAINTDAVS